MDIYRPLTKLREGYVFTGVCDSVHRGGRAWLLGVCGWGVCMAAGGHAWLPGGMHGCRGGMRRIRQDTVNERAVRILLECILVSLNFQLVQLGK